MSWRKLTVWGAGALVDPLVYLCIGLGRHLSRGVKDKDAVRFADDRGVGVRERGDARPTKQAVGCVHVGVCVCVCGGGCGSATGGHAHQRQLAKHSTRARDRHDGSRRTVGIKDLDVVRARHKDLVRDAPVQGGACGRRRGGGISCGRPRPPQQARLDVRLDPCWRRRRHTWLA